MSRVVADLTARANTGSSAFSRPIVASAKPLGRSVAQLVNMPNMPDKRFSADQPKPKQAAYQSVKPASRNRRNTGKSSASSGRSRRQWSSAMSFSSMCRTGLSDHPSP